MYFLKRFSRVTGRVLTAIRWQSTIRLGLH